MEKEDFNMSNLKIGIIMSTTRPNRKSEPIAKWLKTYTDQNRDAVYDIIDLNDYNLPLFGDESNMDGVKAFNEKINQFDGFIFVLAEYNHTVPAALTNAISWTQEVFHNKAAGIVSYGAVGGARAAEHLRNVLAQMQVASVQAHVLLSLFHDFDENGFKPLDIHQKNLNLITNQVEAWSKALKTLR
jgi:NAD(P)H-dependent FMN reductase